MMSLNKCKVCNKNESFFESYCESCLRELINISKLCIVSNFFWKRKEQDEKSFMKARKEIFDKIEDLSNKCEPNKEFPIID